MKKYYSLALLLIISTGIFAQNNIEDVVYLKNGSIIRGKIVDRTNPDKIKIELAGGSVLVFTQPEIDSITRENTLKNKLREINKNYFRRDRGYRNMTELGVIVGVDLKSTTTANSNSDDFGLSLHTVNGYQIWPYLYVGGGVGIDRFITYKQTFSPFYLRLASEFLKKKVTPYVYFDAGYSVMWKQPSNDYETFHNTGGLYLAAGGGVRVYTRSRASVIFSVGYKRNNSKTLTQYTNNYYLLDAGYTTYTTTRVYQRMVINVGVTF